MVDNMALNG
jgi:hypothetical protein